MNLIKMPDFNPLTQIQSEIKQSLQQLEIRNHRTQMHADIDVLCSSMLVRGGGEVQDFRWGISSNDFSFCNGTAYFSFMSKSDGSRLSGSDQSKQPTKTAKIK